MALSQLEEFRHLTPEARLLGVVWGYEMVEPEIVRIGRELAPSIREAVAALPENTQEIIRYRYGFTDGEFHRLREAAEVFGHVTRERIRQLEATAIRRIEVSLRNAGYKREEMMQYPEPVDALVPA